MGKKPFFKKEFDLEFLKRVDLQNTGTMYETDCNNIKEKCRSNYDIDEEMLKNNETITVWDYALDELIDNSNYQYYDNDETMFEEYVIRLIKHSKHYLVFLENSTWRGQSGYRIVDDIQEAFYRGYDCCQYVSGGSVGGKVLQLRESHHDCPTGHTSYIVALTDTEFEKLDNTDFEGIEKFIENIKDRVIEI